MLCLTSQTLRCVIQNFSAPRCPLDLMGYRSKIRIRDPLVPIGAIICHKRGWYLNLFGFSSGNMVGDISSLLHSWLTCQCSTNITISLYPDLIPGILGEGDKRHLIAPCTHSLLMAGSQIFIPLRLLADYFCGVGKAYKCL